ncbi:MAG: hypothetical protein R2831_04095 [Chitinophagaceae bacterium]
MKLESLKSSKFEAFKGSELQNAFRVLGGEKVRTECENFYCDSWDYKTEKSPTSVEAGMNDWCYYETKEMAGRDGIK